MVNKLSSSPGQIRGAIIALAIVTAAHYFWQFSRMLDPQVKLAVYFSSFVLLALGAHFTLRIAVLHSYQQNQRLTNFTLFLLCTNWGLFFAFPSLQCSLNPPEKDCVVCPEDMQLHLKENIDAILIARNH